MTSRIVPFIETKTAVKCKIVLLSMKLHQQNYKGSHMSGFSKIDNGTIFLFSIQRRSNNTIYILVIFSRVLPLRRTNTTAQTSTELFDCPWNCIYSTLKAIIFSCIIMAI